MVEFTNRGEKPEQPEKKPQPEVKKATVTEHDTDYYYSGNNRSLDTSYDTSSDELEKARGKTRTLKTIFMAAAASVVLAIGGYGWYQHEHDPEVIKQRTEKAAAEKKAEEKRIAAEKLAAEKIAAQKKIEAAKKKIEDEKKAAAKKIADQKAAEARKLAAEKAKKDAIEKAEAAKKLAAEKAQKAADAAALAKKLAEEKQAAAKVAAEKKIAEQKLAAEKKAAADKLAALVKQSVAEKVASTYHSDKETWKNEARKTAEVYLNDNGKPVNVNSDFAVHVSLLNNGGISVFVAEGEYAGSRVEFMPAPKEGAPRIVYSKMGEEVTSGDVTLYKAFAAKDVKQATIVKGNGITETKRNADLKPLESLQKYESVSYTKQVSQDGHMTDAFVLYGAPQKDGIFCVQIWNGDSFSFNFKTGEYRMDSAFFIDANYQTKYTDDKPLDMKKAPIVKGTLKVAQQLAPKASTSNKNAPKR